MMIIFRSRKDLKIWVVITISYTFKLTLCKFLEMVHKVITNVRNDGDGVYEISKMRKVIKMKMNRFGVTLENSVKIVVG
jgi:hypothetical protein